MVADKPGPIQDRPTARIYVYLVLANLFWAGNYVFAPIVLTEFTPLQMVYLRWLGALVPLFILAAVIERPNWRAAVREWPMHLGQALLGILGYPLLMYQGLLSVNSLDASLLGAINPALIMILAAIVVRERPSRRVIAGAVVSIAGALIVVTRGDLAALIANGLSVGDLWILASVLAWTFYSVNARRVSTPPITATTFQVVVAMVVLTPFAIAAGPIFPTTVSPDAVLALVYISLFPSALGFVLWNLGVAGAGPSRSGIFLNLIMAFTAIIGLLLGHPVTIVQVLGGLVVFGGVYLSTMRSRQVMESV